MPGDPFDTLGLPPRFDLDQDTVQRAYLARTAAAIGPGGEPDQALAADLNRARLTLDDPEQRATALLARLGGPAKEADRSLPDGFLAEMMEVRERAESERKDPSAAARWEAWGRERRRGHIAAASALFSRALASPTPDPALLREIRRELNAWRYIERMIEQLTADEHPG